MTKTRKLKPTKKRNNNTLKRARTVREKRERETDSKQKKIASKVGEGKLCCTVFKLKNIKRSA